MPLVIMRHFFTHKICQPNQILYIKSTLSPGRCDLNSKFFRCSRPQVQRIFWRSGVCQHMEAVWRVFVTFEAQTTKLISTHRDFAFMKVSHRAFDVFFAHSKRHAPNLSLQRIEKTKTKILTVVLHEDEMLGYYWAFVRDIKKHKLN